jgi:lactoylglutathione lyase
MARMNTSAPTLGWVLLYVDDVSAATTFYASAFGLAVRFAHPSGDYTELETGATVLALCARALAAESTGLALVGRTVPAGNVTLVVDDVPPAYRRAVDAGASAVHEPVTKPWGQVSSYVLDLDGHLVELATAVTT